MIGLPTICFLQAKIVLDLVLDGSDVPMMHHGCITYYLLLKSENYPLQVKIVPDLVLPMMYHSRITYSLLLKSEDYPHISTRVMIIFHYYLKKIVI